MNEFQTINDIVDTSIRNSSYISVLISSGVFIAYMVINKLVDYFKAKEKSKPLIEMASAITKVSENVVKLNQVLNKMIQDAETKESSRINDVILIGFSSFKDAIYQQCVDIIIHNNIEVNRSAIEQNIYKTITIEYYRLYSIFSAYENKGINVATKIDKEWIDEINKECIQIIYNGQDSVSRIRQILNKLNILTEEYSVHVVNKVFNH